MFASPRRPDAAPTRWTWAHGPSWLAGPLALGFALSAAGGCPTTTIDAEVPIADAGPDILSEDPLAAVMLDASASSAPDDAALSYAWEFDTQPPASQLDESDISEVEGSPELATFTPDVSGVYGLTLQVSTFNQDSDLDYLRVQIGLSNERPIADAGANVRSATGANTSLDGGASYDPEGAFLQYRWTIVLKPDESALSDASIFNQGTPNALVIPDSIGVYILALEVSDGSLWSEPDYVTISVADGNVAPVSAAGDSQFLTPCSATEISLDGSASYDPEGVELEYLWSFTILPEGSELNETVMVGRHEANVSFAWDVPGVYVVELLVSDGELWSPPSYVAIQAVPHEPNSAPIAAAPNDFTIDASSICTSTAYTTECAPCAAREVELASTSYDPDRDALVHTWSVLEGPGSIVDPSAPLAILDISAQDTEPARTSEALYVVQLAVNDCENAAFDTTNITFACTGVTP